MVLLARYFELSVIIKLTLNLTKVVKLDCTEVNLKFQSEAPTLLAIGEGNKAFFSKAVYIKDCASRVYQQHSHVG